MSFYDDASWLLIPSGIKEDVVFAQKPTSGLGDLSFSRASDATYTDSTGVVRRSPYNLLQASEDFTVWNKQQVNVSSNVAANPLTGLVNADLLVPDTTSNNHRIYNSGTVTAPSSNIMSVYAKAAGYNYISFGYGGGVGGVGIIFNLSNGTVSGSAVGYSGTMSPAGNGWYLCSFIGNGPTNDYITLSRWIVIRDNSLNQTFTGDGTSGVLVANAQLVEGTSALDYFPTTNRQDVPRIDFRNADGTLSSCGRLLLEPQRTNSIRNSSMVGAVAGSPGTAPTNWENAVLSGLTRTIVGIGTENGLPYVDFRFSGTTSGTSVRIDFESAAQIAALTAQTWTQSIYAKIISAPNPPLNYNLTIIERTSGGSFVASGFQAIVPTSSLQRFNFTRTLSGGATVGAAQPSLSINLTNATAYDFTVRIAAPQMELGAYATTWVPTTTAAVTRIADAASKTGVSSLIGQTEGTLFVDFYHDISGTPSSDSRIQLSNGTTANWIFMGFPDGATKLLRLYVNSTSGGLSFFSNTSVIQGRNKAAFAYKSGDFMAYLNGVQVASNTTAHAIPPCSAINLQGGAPTAVTAERENINQAALFPTRLSNDQLEVLTSEGYGTYALLAQSLNCVLQ